MIKIDTIPVEVLHVLVTGHNRQELLDAAVRSAQRYFGDLHDLIWSEAKIRLIGSHEDTWELECWVTDKTPLITTDDAKSAD